MPITQCIGTINDCSPIIRDEILKWNLQIDSIITNSALYNTLIGIISKKMCTIISMAIAIILYVILIFLLKIFSEDNIFMIPYGQKIYKILKIVGIYGKDTNA